MLRRADNVSISFKPGAFSGKGWLILYVGARRFYRVAKLHKTEVAQCFAQQRTYPVRLASIDERTYWQFQDRFFWDNDGLDAAAVYALLVTRQQRQPQQVDRAQQIVAMGVCRARSVFGVRSRTMSGTSCGPVMVVAAATAAAPWSCSSTTSSR